MIRVGDEGSGAGEDWGHRSMGGMVGLGVLGDEGGLGGGLEDEGGPHPPLVGDGVEGAASSTAPQPVVDGEEQGEVGLAVHGGGGHPGNHFTSVQPSWNFSLLSYSEV